MRICRKRQKLWFIATPLLLLFVWTGSAFGLEIDSPWLHLDNLQVKSTPVQKGKKIGVSRLSLWVSNSGDSALVGPVRVLVNETSMDVENADGYTEDGIPFFTISADANYTLAPGDSSKRISVEFSESHRKGVRHDAHDIKHRDKEGNDRYRGGKNNRDDFYFKAEAQYNPPFMMQLLHTSDMDGATGALTNVKNFSALINYFRAGVEDSTLTLSSGDNFIPGPRYTAAEDESMADLLGIPGAARGDIVMLNAMGFQASAVGNHDLDGGTSTLASAITPEVADTAYYEGALFPYLSCNLDFTTDANLIDLTVGEGFPAINIPSSLTGSTIIPVNGEYVGVVGATTPKLASITSTGDITVSPLDSDDIAGLAGEIQTAVDALTATGINKVILLAHMQQIGVEIQLAGLLHDVDIIVAGGSNTLLADDDDLIRDGDSKATDCVADSFNTAGATCTYPIRLTSMTGQPVLIVNTDGDYKYLGRLVIGFDGNGVVVPESLDTENNGAFATDDSSLARFGSPVANEEVTAVADGLSEVLAARDGNILGTTSVFLEGRRNLVRTEETNLGDLSADANLWAARQVDPDTVISLKNGGGIRDDIGYFEYPPGSVSNDDLVYFPPAANPAIGKKAGDISQFDLQGALRFNNSLSLVTVTAKELVAIVEHGVSATESGATPGQFPQVAGMRFSFDPDSPAYSRIVNLVVETTGGDDIVVRNGELAGDTSRIFRMVTLGFLAEGGDSYPFPDLYEASTNYLELTGVTPTGLGSVPSDALNGRDADFADPGTEQDALAEYLQEYFDPVLSSTSAPYAEEESPASGDERIQNLSVREDTVIR